MLLNDEVFQNGGSPWQDQGLFNDILFNGQTKSLEISLPNEDYYWNEAGYIWSYRNIGLAILFIQHFARLLLLPKKFRIV